MTTKSKSHLRREIATALHRERRDKLRRIPDSEIEDLCALAEATEEEDVALACRVALGRAIPAASGFVTTEDALEVIARRLGKI